MAPQKLVGLEDVYMVEIRGKRGGEGFTFGKLRHTRLWIRRMILSKRPIEVSAMEAMAATALREAFSRRSVEFAAKVIITSAMVRVRLEGTRSR